MHLNNLNTAHYCNTYNYYVVIYMNVNGHDFENQLFINQNHDILYQIILIRIMLI